MPIAINNSLIITSDTISPIKQTNAALTSPVYDDEKLVIALIDSGVRIKHQKLTNVTIAQYTQAT